MLSTAPRAQFAFDLVELDGEDLRPAPDQAAQAHAGATASPRRSIAAAGRALAHRRSDRIEHACALGCDGIVSKRVGSRYVAGRTDHWIKVKNPAAPAVKREAEVEWGR
jgi:bifunctional non-homologous end joining protein LigD